MQPSAKRPAWWQRHALITVVGCSAVGASVGLIIAFTLPSSGEPHFVFQVLSPAAFLAVAGAGFLFGVLGGLLLVRIGDTGSRCPRCGSPIDERADRCSACDLNLR